MYELKWEGIDLCPKDRPVLMYCPGHCTPTGDVLMGQWLERLQIWELMPYGTTQPVTLFPTMWAEIPPGPR
jgi:hypothetical protein